MIDRLVRRYRARRLKVWYHPDFQLPIPELRHEVGMEPRRADFVAWYLMDQGFLPAKVFRVPERVSFEELTRIHEPAFLEAIVQPGAISQVLGMGQMALAEEEIFHTFRLGCGATLAAALEVVEGGGTALNLLGGFHHATPTRAAGFCLVNDIAVAVARLRSMGFRGRVVVIDLDAHPPDGTATCLADDLNCWIGSLSGVDWGPLPGVDETVLPERCGDAPYLSALSALLGRMPAPEVAFVVAGGDVLAGDKLGQLGLSLEGARSRDRMVLSALGGAPSVWVPGGGYSGRSWRVLAGTALALIGRSEPIPDAYNPLTRRFEVVAGQLQEERLGDALLTVEDLAEALHLAGPRRTRMMGYYTAEGLEYALFQYGILAHIERLGYKDFQVLLDATEGGDRMRVMGRAEGQEMLLVELVLERKRVGDAELLYIHWLTLRHPLAAFGPRRPKLPGQDVPGLGLASEAVTMLRQMALRLKLQGLCYNPGWFHTAYVARADFRFIDPARQGRFLALLRDLGHLPLAHLTQALAEGRVWMNDRAYTWEPDTMVRWEGYTPPDDSAAVAAERDHVRFHLQTKRS